MMYVRSKIRHEMPNKEEGKCMNCNEWHDAPPPIRHRENSPLLATFLVFVSIVCIAGVNKMLFPRSYYLTMLRKLWFWAYAPDKLGK